MLKFRADRRVRGWRMVFRQVSLDGIQNPVFYLSESFGSFYRAWRQNDQNGTTGYPIIQSPLEEIHSLQRHAQSTQLEMNGKAVGKGPVNTSSDVNSNCLGVVTEPSAESQPNGRGSRSSKKAVAFGKRSNSMRRNPRAEVAKQGWLFKQASNGVKQWNKRWFVLSDRCLFYYKDEKEEGILGSLPLLSFQIGLVQPADNISRKYAFKVFCEVEDKEANSNGGSGFCLQAEHAGIRTYYFSAESTEEQEDWVHAMSEAARMHVAPAQSKNNSENIPLARVNSTAVTKGAETHQRAEGDGQRVGSREASRQEAKREVNGVEAKETTTTTPRTPNLDGRNSVSQPNGWGKYEASHGPAFQLQESHEQRENAVHRRGFVPRTQSERMAQRKSSMSQLQQWVNQRRCMTAQEDSRSPSRFYTMNRGMAPDYFSIYGGSPYVEEYPLYPPGVRPDSICSVSAGFDKLSPQWAAEERRRSLRDGPLYGREPQWAMAPPIGPPGYYGPLDSAETSMRRLSMQPRSRSVPRSPSASSPGPYSPGPRSFPSPVRSPSAPFDRGTGRHREDPIYADPSIYGLRRSISSPKYEYPGDRRSISQGMYHYKYPGSPSLHDKMEDIIDLQLQRNLEYLDQQVMEGEHLINLVTRMVENSPRAKFYLQVPPFHDIYRDIHPSFKANEIEIGKLLARLCDQHRLLKDQETVVQRLRMEKDSLEGALVATHHDLELYRSQPSMFSKLQLNKETLQNQLINIRGELSQASSALTTTRMEFDALEDEVNAVHGDLWEQLNAGGQSELVHRQIQKEFWKIQDVLEGLHKNNSSRGTDTAKNRVASGASGSFSTNSPVSPLSSISVTSPLSPFSPVSGSQSSPSKLAAMEDIGPPRPPLPKFYLPLESHTATPPSVLPPPLDSGVWHRSVGQLSGSAVDTYQEEDQSKHRELKFNYRSDSSSREKINSSDRQEVELDRQANMNKVGVVPPRTKSPTEDELNSYDPIYRRNGITRERPKSAVFPAEVRSKMTVEEQNERIRRNQSSSMRDKRRSLNLPSSQQIDGFKPSTSYRVVRRRLTAHEVDIKDLEAAVRGEGVESPREEIARLRRLQIEPDPYKLDINKELSAPEKVLIPERYLDIEPSTPLSPEEEREKQKKVERIKTLIAKSNMQNVVPVLDGPTEGQADSEQQLQEQEKRIEISCALAAEASRRSRLLSAQCAPSPSASPISLVPLSSADFSDSSQILKV